MTRDGLATSLEEALHQPPYEPGTKLPSERQLAISYGVSRPVVREALRTLAERGLIDIRPGRGAYVRQARTSDAARPLAALYRRQRVTPRDVVEARVMLEREAVRLAATRADDKDIEAMELTLTRLDNASDLIERARWDIAFHALVARAAHNPMIETMFGSISSLAFELMLRSLGDPNVSSVGLPYHQEIFEAIRDRNPKRAQAAIEAHLEVAKALYGIDLDQSLHLVARRELRRIFGETVSLDALLADLHAPASPSSDDD